MAKNNKIIKKAMWVQIRAKGAGLWTLVLRCRVCRQFKGGMSFHKARGIGTQTSSNS